MTEFNEYQDAKILEEKKEDLKALEMLVTKANYATKAGNVSLACTLVSSDFFTEKWYLKTEWKEKSTTYTLLKSLSDKKYKLLEVSEFEDFIELAEEEVLNLRNQIEKLGVQTC